jgi:hypothetical protein
MTPGLDIARRYLEAWNAHDADAILATFAPGGTYCDPTTGEISGEAIAANATLLLRAPGHGDDEAPAHAEAGRSNRETTHA